MVGGGGGASPGSDSPKDDDFEVRYARFDGQCCTFSMREYNTAAAAALRVQNTLNRARGANVGNNDDASQEK